MNFKDTIGIFDNVLSKTNCKRYIKRLEDAIKDGHAGPGMASSGLNEDVKSCLLYTSPSPRDRQKSRMPSSA